MTVRLETEDPMLRRKDNARDLLDIGDVVCGSYPSAYLDVVVVSPQQSFLIEVKCLFCAVGCNIHWKMDLQTTPRFFRFLPWLEFFRLDARSGQEKRSIQIRPHGASDEVCKL